MFTLLAVAVVIVGLVFLASRADAIRARRRPPQLPLRLSVDELGVRDGRFRRFLDWLRREWAAQQERSRNRPSGFGGFGGFGGGGGGGGGGGCGFGGGGGGGGCGGGGEEEGASPPACPRREETMADKDTGESFDLGAVSDEEARRWQDYAERWGTDQYDDGPWIWTALEYVVLAYIIGTAPLKVWALLVKVGLAD